MGRPVESTDALEGVTKTVYDGCRSRRLGHRPARSQDDLDLRRRRKPDQADRPARARERRYDLRRRRPASRRNRRKRAHDALHLRRRRPQGLGHDRGRRRSRRYAYNAAGDLTREQGRETARSRSTATTPLDNKNVDDEPARLALDLPSTTRTATTWRRSIRSETGLPASSMRIGPRDREQPMRSEEDEDRLRPRRACPLRHRSARSQDDPATTATGTWSRRPTRSVTRRPMATTQPASSSRRPTRTVTRPGYGYDADGRKISITAPDGSITNSAYDAAGNLIARTDANGHVTSYSYDAAGRKISMTNPLGSHCDLLLRRGRQPRSRRRTRSETSRATTYDALNREIASYRRPRARRQRRHTTRPGTSSRQIDPLGHESTSAYDADGTSGQDDRPARARDDLRLRRGGPAHCGDRRERAHDSTTPTTRAARRPR